MIFDVKPDFTRKPRMIEYGHVTDSPISLTYSSVVARDSIRHAFLIAALNGLQLLSADISKEFLNAYTDENVHTVCGGNLERNPLVRSPSIFCSALYGVKSGAAAWPSRYAVSLCNLRFPTLQTPISGCIQSLFSHKIISSLDFAKKLESFIGPLSYYATEAFISVQRLWHSLLHSPVFHIFAYSKTYTRSKIVLDDATPQVDPTQFIAADWFKFLCRRSWGCSPECTRTSWQFCLNLFSSGDLTQSYWYFAITPNPLVLNN